MDLNTSFIAEIMGLALVFVGLFKLDSINKSLGAFSEFAKTASNEIASLRKQSSYQSEKLKELKTHHELKEYYERQQSKTDQRSGSATSH